MTIVTIRQPGYLPYLGFFKKIMTSDVFVYFDDAQYEVRGWDNRNKINTKKGLIWITVPVVHPFKKRINEIMISYSKNWISEHENIIEANYEKTPYFGTYWNEIKTIMEKRWEKLVDLNIALIEYFNSILSINARTIRSSSLKSEGVSSQKLGTICKELNASTYQSGIMGKEYLDESLCYGM